MGLFSGKKVKGVVPKSLTVYFQIHPGTKASSGIEDVDYVYKIGGKTIKSGKTGTGGKIELPVPKGKTGTLQVFGSVYKVKLKTVLEPETKLKGIQRRLHMLGYECGSVDGKMGPKTDREILNFEADQGLDTDGVAATARAKLKSVVGE